MEDEKRKIRGKKRRGKGNNGRRMRGRKGEGMSMVANSHEFIER